jgi:hypothetical protein
MPSIPTRSIDGRWLAAAVVVLYGLLFAEGVRSLGVEQTLYAAGVPSVGAPFSDLYIFPSAATEFSRGGNPYVSNPTDPWGRPYNYPKVWLLFMRFPFAGVPLLGFAIGAAWLATVAVALGRLAPGQGVIAGVLVCSPPAALAIERGNTDLLIFIIVAAALACLGRRWRGPAWLLVFAGAVLKVYPAAVFAAFLRPGCRRAWAWLAAGIAAFAIWAGLHFGEFQSIARTTPTGGPAVSYGSTVVFSIAEKLHGDRTGEWGAYVGEAWLGRVAAVLLAAGLFWAGVGRRARTGGTPVPAVESPERTVGPGVDRALVGFYAGAGIYVATFIIGSNFAYRQIFLLFCLPWLLRRGAGYGLQGLRTTAAAILFLLLWANPMWWIPLLALRETAAWSLVGILAYLVGAAFRAESEARNIDGPNAPSFASG